MYEMWSENIRYFKYFQKLFIKKYLAPFKVTLLVLCLYLCQRFFQSSKHFWNALFGIANSFCFTFISSIVAKRSPFIVVFSFEIRKESARAKWGMITVLFLAKNSRTCIDVWVGTLSWFKIHDWFFHNSMRVWQITSRNQRITWR